MHKVIIVKQRARLIVSAAMLLLSASARAQSAQQHWSSETAGRESVAPTRTYSAGELAELVGPIALYPDDLVAIVLPASTYPLQVVQAANFLAQLQRNPRLEPGPELDESIVALLNYPVIVDLLNKDLDWTRRLGEAFLAQEADVILAIGQFRERAWAAGNLRSDEYQLVSREDGVLKITPLDPQVIYVPYYEPRRVIYYSPLPVYHYYPWRYASYYYPYPAGYSFSFGFFWGGDLGVFHRLEHPSPARAPLRLSQSSLLRPSLLPRLLLSAPAGGALVSPTHAHGP